MTSTTDNIAFLAGPQLLGLFFNWALQGVLTVQVYIYHLWFPYDRLSMKLLVYGILLYEWIQTGLITSFAFDNFVYGYGKKNVLTQFHNSWFSVTIMSSVISWIVQTFFAWRIWVLGRSRILTGAIIFISFAQMSVGVTGGILLRVVDPSAASASAVTPVISSWLGGAALTDILIAISMTVLLTKSKSGVKRSDDMIDSLTRLVIETGSVTAIVAILDLAFFTGLSDTLLHECAALVLAKLYSNTLLASLNNRAIMRMTRAGPIIDTGTHTFELSTTADSSRTGAERSLASIPGVYALSGIGRHAHGAGTKGGAKPFRVDVREDMVVASDFSTASTASPDAGGRKGVLGDGIDSSEDTKVPTFEGESYGGSRPGNM